MNTMKRIIILLTLLSVAGTQTMAQSSWKAQKRQLSSMSFTVANFSESLFGLSQADIMGMISNPADRINMDDFRKADYFNTAMTGAYVNLNVGVAKQIRPGLLSELQLGVALQTNGELMLDYEAGDWRDAEYEYLSLCYMNNRVGVSAGYKLRKLGRRSSFSYGPSVSLSKTFDDVVIFLGSSSRIGLDDTVEASSSTVSNINFAIDYGYRVVGNLALNIGATYGATYFMSSTNSNSLGHNYNISFGLEYQFFRNWE